MKKMNKKGFTLAELLIVIAIIAVLIAIAIPTFAGALENARRQTDHANMRNVYAMMQVANLQDGKFTAPDGSLYSPAAPLYLYKDGTLDSTYDAAKVYTLLANHKTTGSDCSESIVCTKSLANPAKDNIITLLKNGNEWSIAIATNTPPAGP